MLSASRVPTGSRAATCMATSTVQHHGQSPVAVINKSRDGYVSIEYDPTLSTPRQPA